VSKKAEEIQKRLDSISHGWRERTKYNHHLTCRQCHALRKHEGVSCAEVAVRLIQSVNLYDPKEPWAWPPESVYER